VPGDLPAFIKVRLNFLACGALIGQWIFVLGRALLLVSRPEALAFRLRLFGSRSIGACFLFVRLRCSYFQREYNTRFTRFGTHDIVRGKTQAHVAARLPFICCSCSAKAKGCRGELADVVGATAWFAVCLMPVDCIAIR
jgi:hypothetical protein